MDFYVVPPLRRARIDDAPQCPNCGRRLRVGSTAPRVAYYYPACGCVEAQSVKRRRPVDLSRLPHNLRRVFGLHTEL